MNYFKGKNKYITISLIIVIMILLGIFTPSNILIEPLLTPSEYLSGKPYLSISDNFLIIVPSSTVFVYLLGIQILYIGYKLLRKNLPLWGISLLFWGVGTLLAGTSYQGLGYMLKCAQNEYCLFTSWFELAYLFVTALSIAIMGLAFSQLFITSKRRRVLEGYSKFIVVLYTFLLLLGSMIQNRILISYEVFTIFFMPLFLVFFIINIINYRKTKDDHNKQFIILWILFLIVNVSYYIYYIPGITERLYTNTNIWFSANDVLHIGLIIWFGYFYYKVIPKIPITRTNNPVL